jgi:predicted PurR-regulated permease PerM
MDFPVERRRTPPNASVRIIAAGVVFGFCYWASTVVITVLVSILVAYLLDPVVELLERFRVPRAAGALVVLLVALTLLTGLGWFVAGGIEQFGESWPKYSGVLKQATAAVQERVQALEKRFSEIAPEEEKKPRTPEVRVREESPVRGLLLRGLGGLYTALLALSFIPFLVFFMLAGKRDLWHGTMQLFPPTERTRVRDTLDAVAGMLRGFILGNLIVAGILAMVSALFFWIIGLDYPVLTGIVSGILNLVPYLGVVLAWLPPLVIGLTKYHTLGPFVGIAAVLGLFHLIAINFLVPPLVGRKVHLNAITVTIALLFWGWLWGGMGLILAIPIMATIKVICDHVENWRPVGRWLGT